VQTDVSWFREEWAQPRGRNFGLHRCSKGQEAQPSAANQSHSQPIIRANHARVGSSGQSRRANASQKLSSLNHQFFPNR